MSNQHPDTLHFDIDTPDGHIKWNVPIKPLPGQPASYLKQKLQEIETLIDMRNRYNPNKRHVQSLTERRALAYWRQAYQRSLANERHFEAILNKHSKAG